MLKWDYNQKYEEDTVRPCQRRQNLQWEWVQGHILHCTSLTCLASFGHRQGVMYELACSV